MLLPLNHNYLFPFPSLKMTTKLFEDAPHEVRRLALFIHNFQKESDRGASLMAGSVIDEVLKEIIAGFLINKKESLRLLDGFNAPLGTFSSRILAAYCLGLVEKHEYKELEILRRIRNAFGHTWSDIDFSNPKISALVRQLPTKDTNLRSKYHNSVANLLGELIYRHHEVSQSRRKLKSWPKKYGFIKRNRKSKSET